MRMLLLHFLKQSATGLEQGRKSSMSREAGRDSVPEPLEQKVRDFYTGRPILEPSARVVGHRMA